MVSSYKTPGVYIKEIAKFPPSVVPVETAIPAFLGYTQVINYQGEDLVNRPVEISSFLEFEQVFGTAPPLGGFTVVVDANGRVQEGIPDPNQEALARFRLAYALRHFYDNGGSKCYVISLGNYSASGGTSAIVDAHVAGLAALAKEDEPTLIVMPDLSGMTAGVAALTDPAEIAAAIAATRASYHGVLVQALNQCATLGDRFLIGDLWDGDQAGAGGIEAFRNGIGTSNLRYGAVYHPYIHTTLPWAWAENEITVSQPFKRDADGDPVADMALRQLLVNETGNPDNDARVDTTLYAAVRQELDRYTVILPPAAAVAGVYATVDRTRGVWKSPANESLTGVRSLTVNIDNRVQDDLNVHPTGKSINALRFFTGKGNLVWGARTLAGNDNEWRYVAVRRFFNMAEESIKKATEAFVFEPNDANTWIKVKAMIENFLILQWRAGALAGAKPEDAFYVRVGLGVTMTAQDILEGRMNVELGMAVVRPAEFIILKFSHKMQEA
ncbi:MAG: phage tail sheath family protein [Leptolyngbya sp. SIOISBB]|nr:phage tail sheath family protein [Leptolyngbya sp. SIOISBB]